MTHSGKLPPGVREEDKVVLFDGVCKLCNAWAVFLIRFDRKRRFKLASVQSKEGAAILDWFGFPTDTYETMLLVEGPCMYQRSTAFIRVVARLPLPWKLATVVWLIPSPIRNWLYDRVALNRYQVFGKFDACVLPTPDHLERYLNAD